MGVYCCGDKAECMSYVDDRLVNFKYIKQEAGSYHAQYKIDGIGWIFVISGTIHLKTSLGQEKDVEGGMMCLLPVGECWVEMIGAGELIFFTSDRPTEYCVQLVKRLSDKDVVSGEEIRELGLRPLVMQFLDLLRFCLKDGINCRRWYEIKQQELFMILEACYSKEELSVFLHSLKSHKDNDLKKFILENNLKAKNVQELADICGYSVGGFKRVFKEMFNEPIYKWMLKQKAEQLKLRLADKEVNLKIIVDEFGFSSPAHFTKFCKQWLGMVPTKFIKSQQEKFEL